MALYGEVVFLREVFLLEVVAEVVAEAVTEAVTEVVTEVVFLLEVVAEVVMSLGEVLLRDRTSLLEDIGYREVLDNDHHSGRWRMRPAP